MRVPPIISRLGKGRNFKFCMHILSIDRNKSPLQISGKVPGGVCKDSRNFSGHPYTPCPGKKEASVF